MSTTAHKIDADDVQHARAAHMRYLFEPWSLRKLEARTGIGRSKLHSKFNGTTEFSIGDIEILAPVIRMTPAQLATELYAITGKEKSAATGTVTTLPVRPERLELPTLSVKGPHFTDDHTATILPFTRKTA